MEDRDSRVFGDVSRSEYDMDILLREGELKNSFSSRL
jgi:hypothetical protein